LTSYFSMLVDADRPASRRDHRVCHAFVQNLRRGHYELATDVPARRRIHGAFDQLAMAI